MNPSLGRCRQNHQQLFQILDPSKANAWICMLSEPSEQKRKNKGGIIPNKRFFTSMDGSIQNNIHNCRYIPPYLDSYNKENVLPSSCSLQL